MKTESYSSLGLQWPITVPETPEEFNTLAKKPNAVVEVANDHTVYHDTLGNIRVVFCEKVDEFLSKPEMAATRTANGFSESPTQVPWDSGNKDSEGEVIELNEAAWFNKVKAVTGKDETAFAFLQADVLKDERCRFDPSVKEKKPAQPKKIPANALSAANNLILNHGKSEIEGKKLAAPVDAIGLTNKLAQLNPTAPKPEFDDKGMPKPESLARLIAANEARKRAQAKLAAVYAEDVG